MTKDSEELQKLVNDFSEHRGGIATGALAVVLLNDNAQLPTYGSNGAAGMDLYASEGLRIPAGKWGAVPIGISVEIPPSLYGRIAPRSGLSFKHGIDVFAGVIDSDYRGEIKVILYNAGTRALQVRVGDRVGQMVMERFIPCLPVQVEFLADTIRGGGGFGSTGK